LVISDYLDTEDLLKLNSLNILFVYMYRIIKYIKPQYIYELFEYNKDYASQKEMPFKRKMQFLFLALINRLQIPAVIRSLKENYTILHRKFDEILAKCE